MVQKVDLTDANEEFQEKVYVIADEVLNILKELSRENKQKISSKTIADKMVWNESVKNALAFPAGKSGKSFIDPVALKGISNEILDKFTVLIPSHISDNFSNLREEIHENIPDVTSTDWLNTPIELIKQYIDYISVQKAELEDLMKQTMDCLEITEVQMTTGLSTQQEQYKSDRIFESTLTSDITTICTDIDKPGNLAKIKVAIKDKIDRINKVINSKKQDDSIRLKKTEDTIEEMSKRMSEIKREADEIRRKSEEIQYEVYQDSLTGLQNRRAYDQKIEEVLADVTRYNVTASLVLCDIDFFKKINDNNGHKVGDLALKKLASLLKERLRINDFTFRYGGEEFAVILPHTDLDGAQKVGESLRAFIDESIFSYRNQEIPLTISVGISLFRKGDTTSTVFERADSALYMAKRSGRNKVLTEEDVTEQQNSPTHSDNDELNIMRT